jgi:hypothetical protein
MKGNCIFICMTNEGRPGMNIGEDVLVALFCMSMVFVLLAAIYGLMKLTSLVIGHFFAGKTDG